MIRHDVTVMITAGGFGRGASHQATCATCGWLGGQFADRDSADAEVRHHSELTTGDASTAAENTAARTEARGRMEAALGDPEHQRALDAEIDRHLRP